MLVNYERKKKIKEIRKLERKNTIEEEYDFVVAVFSVASRSKMIASTAMGAHKKSPKKNQEGDFCRLINF